MHFARTRTSPRPRPARVLVALLALTLGLTTACTVGGTATQADPAITGFVTGVSAANNSGSSSTTVDQTLGQGVSGGPTLSLRGDVTVVNGGSVLQNPTSSTPYKKLRIALEEKHNGQATGVPAKGYTELSLGSASANATVVMTLAQNLPSEQFAFYFAGVDESGQQGPMVRQEVKALKVGTGAVQVTASWDVNSDVDLMMVEPDGDKIYFNAKTSSAGGQLDLDSNANCDIDGTRNENITYPHAPAGEYTVYINLYASCGTAASNYVVTVSVGGQTPQTFTGQLTGSGTRTSSVDQATKVTTFRVA